MSVYTDGDLEELIRRTLKVAEDNNRMLRAMRREVIWGRFFKVVFWIILIGGSYVVYYMFVAPYMTQLLHMYDQVMQFLPR